MQVVSEQLDVDVQIPKELSNEFEWEVGSRTYRYEMLAWGLRWSARGHFLGHASITKSLKIPRRWWRLWRGWQRIWTVSTSSFVFSIFGGQHADVRRDLINAAVNSKGIMPSELLLDRSLGPIEDQLERESRRLLELHDLLAHASKESTRATG